MARYSVDTFALSIFSLVEMGFYYGSYPVCGLKLRV